MSTYLDDHFIVILLKVTSQTHFYYNIYFNIYDFQNAQNMFFHINIIFISKYDY